ncbi:phosphorylase family protein [Thiomicrospira sp. S5]|uniref:phosphorylase family protein n=1 Tax=Thiomicrospira sp. S5 TaxID=1803865 RepID=UPI000F89F04E|nr:hypothetical protein [Thiomicrospira sp. S5]AZR82849.1 hypothetical protein AYJ59_11515 [Thiomicrospira sp. S5]
MNILLVEDDDKKAEKIADFIKQNESIDNPCIDRKCNLVEARRAIHSTQYDLIIFDFYLPNTASDGAEAIDVSSDLVGEFSNSKNYVVEAIAITQYDTSELESTIKFSRHDVSVVHFSEDSDEWKRALEKKFSKIVNKTKYDFLLFCALQEERNAYADADCELGGLAQIKGLDCQKVTIDGKYGLCIVPPQMGLVSMGIVAAKAMDYFQPEIVAMSGICAGVKDEVNMLDVVVGNYVWDYSAGKMTEDSFKPEPYQSMIATDLVTFLRQEIEKGQVLKSMKRDLFVTELKNSGAKLAPIASGPYVLADQDRVEEIQGFHRKVAGIEMEMSAFYRAAEQSMCSPKYFGAKSVVDLGDKNKDDSFHGVGCRLSARFVVDILRGFFDR